MSTRTVQSTNHSSNKSMKTHKRHSKKSIDDTSSSSEDDTPSTPPLHHQKASFKRHNHYHQQSKSMDQVYAGPTFSNAPAPSALPIPAFNTRGSPIQHHFQPLYIDSPQKSAYETNLALSEIQRSLRSMLKIQS